MKTLKYLVLGFLAIAGLTLQSCSSDDYDVQGSTDDFVYIDFPAQKEFTYNVYLTPEDVFGSDVEISLPVKIQYPKDRDVNVYANVANSYIASYNEANETEYQALPQEVIDQVSVVNTVIKAGKYEAEAPVELTLSKDAYAALSDGKYLLPVRITSFAKENVRGSEDYGVAYVFINATDKLARFSGNTIVKTSVLNLQGNVSGSVAGNFNVALAYALKNDLAVELVPNFDEEVVKQFNIDNTLAAKSLPAEFASRLQTTASTVAAGRTSTSNALYAALDDAILPSLEVGSYVIPFNLKYTYATGETILDEDQVAYIYFEVIDHVAAVANATSSDMKGTAITSYTNWSSNPSGLFTSRGSVNTNYSLGSSIPGTFTVTMPDVRKVTGITLCPFYAQYGYGWGSIKMEVSTDNSTWIDLGELSGDEITFASSRSWYVLNGGIEAKYLRITAEVPVASSYGTYYNRITSFAVYAE